MSGTKWSFYNSGREKKKSVIRAHLSWCYLSRLGSLTNAEHHSGNGPIQVEAQSIAVIYSSSNEDRGNVMPPRREGHCRQQAEGEAAQQQQPPKTDCTQETCSQPLHVCRRYVEEIILGGLQAWKDVVWNADLSRWRSNTTHCQLISAHCVAPGSFFFSKCVHFPFFCLSLAMSRKAEVKTKTTC